MSPQLSGCARLSLLARQSHRSYVGGGTAQAATEAKLAEVFHKAGDAGFSCFEDSSGVRAYLALWHEAEAWHGAPAQMCVMDHRLADNAAIEWLVAELTARATTFTSDFELQLDSVYREVFAACLTLGLGLDSVILVGETKRALAAARKGSSEALLTSLGLTARAQKATDADAIVAMQEEIYSRAPEFCWFGANPKYLAAERARLEQPASNDRIGIAVEDSAREVVGYAGADIEDSLHWGRHAGLHLVVAPPLQRQGLGSVLYQMLLGALVDRGVPTFKGGTSQPAVLKLGQRMGRELVAWNIRRSVRFPLQHFTGYT